MRSAVWGLSGPRRFVSGVVQDAIAGQSVLVALPSSVRSADLVLGIRTLIPAYSFFKYVSFDYLRRAPSVVDGLLAMVAHAGDPHGSTSVDDLLVCDHIDVPIVLAVDFGVEWTAVVEFLAVVARVQELRLRKALGSIACIVFFTPDDVLDASTLIPNNGNLRWWWGVCRHWDPYQYVLDLAPDSGLDVLDCAVVAEIASFDLDLADRLCSEWTGEWKDALEMCATRVHRYAELDASQLGLPGYCTDTHPPRSSRRLWADGVMDFGGRSSSRFHAGIGVRVDASEFHRRVWSAQVVVLFHRLERARLDVAGQLDAALIGCPIHRSWAAVEIGDMWSAFQSLEVPIDLFEAVRILRDLRNALAHRRPLGSVLDAWARDHLLASY